MTSFRFRGASSPSAARPEAHPRPRPERHQHKEANPAAEDATSAGTPQITLTQGTGCLSTYPTRHSPEWEGLPSRGRPFGSGDTECRTESKEGLGGGSGSGDAGGSACADP
jgi:hypothetical protein